MASSHDHFGVVDIFDLLVINRVILDCVDMFKAAHAFSSLRELQNEN